MFKQPPWRLATCPQPDHLVCRGQHALCQSNHPQAERRFDGLFWFGPVWPGQQFLFAGAENQVQSQPLEPVEWQLAVDRARAVGQRAVGGLHQLLPHLDFLPGGRDLAGGLGATVGGGGQGHRAGPGLHGGGGGGGLGLRHLHLAANVATGGPAVALAECLAALPTPKRLHGPAQFGRVTHDLCHGLLGVCWLTR